MPRAHLPHRLWFAFVSTAMAALFVGSPPYIEAADSTIAVRLRDGRRAEGTLALRPDAESLRITSTAAGVVVTSRFLRGDITTVELDGREVSYAELLDDASRRSWPQPSKPVGGRIQVGPSSAPAPRRLASPPAASIAPHVASLVITAEPGQWDADALPDGFFVQIAPRDAGGGLVPVRAELTLVLSGFRQEVFVRDSYRLEPRPVELARLTVLLTEADFTAGPAVVRFPFGPGLPELRERVDRDFTVEPTCLLSARMGVPTQGVYEAVAPATLRPWNPLVDRLPYFEGRTDLFRLRP